MYLIKFLHFYSNSLYILLMRIIRLNAISHNDCVSISFTNISGSFTSEISMMYYTNINAASKASLWIMLFINIKSFFLEFFLDIIFWPIFLSIFNYLSYSCTSFYIFPFFVNLTFKCFAFIYGVLMFESQFAWGFKIWQILILCLFPVSIVLNVLIIIIVCCVQNSFWIQSINISLQGFFCT